MPGQHSRLLPDQVGCFSSPVANRNEAKLMTIDTEEQYQDAITRLKALADLPDEDRNEAEFLDLSAAMVAYEASISAPAQG